MPDYNSEASKVWDALRPAIDSEIDQRTRGMVQRRKAKVTTAPSLVTNKIGVTEPYGTEIFIPFVSNLASAVVGDYVWVEFMYGANNSFASMFASADSKDQTVAGNLTVGGVLDVTKRRAYSSSLSAGTWYRVLVFDTSSLGSSAAAYARGATGNEVVFHITRRRTTAGEETHEIKMLCQYDGVTFTDETSKSLSSYQRITQIRYTYDSTHGYVDIYAMNDCAYVTVDFEVYCEPAYQALYTSGNLVSAPAGGTGTVMTTYTFVANGAATGDLTVNGVLDVTQRRCEATLPTSGNGAGWYRAIVYNAYDANSAQGTSGEIVTIRIVYTSQVSVQHEISLFMTKGKVAFLNETSHGTTNLVDQIRYNYNGSTGYIDIHWTTATPCYVNVSFDVASRNYAQGRWVAGTLASVADSPSGETVLTEYTFAANGNNALKVIGASGTTTSGAFAISEASVTPYSRVVATPQYFSNTPSLSWFIMLQPINGGINVYVRDSSGGIPANGTNIDLDILIDNR